MYLINNLGEHIQVQKTDLFHKVASLLEEGNIIAIKNTSGFLLCCNAENKSAVQKLRHKKQRPNKPFAVLYPSMHHLKSELVISTEQAKSLNSVERPINIIDSGVFKGKINLIEEFKFFCLCYK